MMTAAPARQDKPVQSPSGIWPAAGTPGACLEVAAQTSSVGTGNIEQEAPSAAVLAGGMSYGSSPGGPVNAPRPPGTIISAKYFTGAGGPASPAPQGTPAMPAPPDAPGTVAAKNDDAIPQQELPVDTKLHASTRTYATDQDSTLSLADRTKGLVDILSKQDLTPEKRAGVLAALSPVQLDSLKEASKALPPQAAAVFAKNCAAAIGMMKISNVSKSTLDGIVNIGSAVLAGLDAHRGGLHGAEIEDAMDQIEEHILAIPPGDAEAKFLESLHGVADRKLEPRERAAKLANLVKPPGVAPELWAGALQRLLPNQMDNVEEVFKDIDPAVAPLVKSAFVEAIKKMRPSAARRRLVIDGLADPRLGPKVSDIIKLARMTDPRHPAALANKLKELARDPQKINDFQKALENLAPQDEPGVVATALAAAIRQIDGRQRGDLMHAFHKGIGILAEKTTGADRLSLNAAAKPGTAAAKNDAAVPEQQASYEASLVASTICNHQLRYELAAAFIADVSLQPGQLAINLASLVKAPGFVPALLTKGLGQLGNTNRLNYLSAAVHLLPPEDAKAVAKALAAAIGDMKISGVSRSTRDGIVNIGTAVLDSYDGGRRHGKVIWDAMQQIEKHLQESAPDGEEAKLLNSLHGVAHDEIEPRRRAVELNNLVKPPGAAPELWAKALQRLAPNEIDSLKELFKEELFKDPAVASRVESTFTNAVKKMRASEARRQLDDVVTRAFPHNEPARDTAAPTAPFIGIGTAKPNPDLTAAGSSTLDDNFARQPNSAASIALEGNKIAPDAAQARLLASVRDGVKTAAKLAAFVKSSQGIAPELLAGALQEVRQSEIKNPEEAFKITNLEESFKALAEPDALLAVRTFVKIIEKMKDKSVKSEFAVVLRQAFVGQARSQVILDAIAPVRQYESPVTTLSPADRSHLKAERAGAYSAKAR